MTNGNVKGDGVPLMRDQSLLECDKAEQVLQTKYNEKDGVDVNTLLDSNRHGALTYNDFLVLPGYIGTGQPCNRVFPKGLNTDQE